MFFRKQILFQFYSSNSWKVADLYVSTVLGASKPAHAPEKLNDYDFWQFLTGCQTYSACLSPEPACCMRNLSDEPDRCVTLVTVSSDVKYKYHIRRCLAFPYGITLVYEFMTSLT